MQQFITFKDPKKYKPEAKGCLRYLEYIIVQHNLMFSQMTLF
jgi:hypothetical protein